MLDSFHPTVQRWFADRLGTPSPPQLGGWPHIAVGKHTLIAAPTGSGKTLAAFLHALDQLLQSGPELADQLHVIYVSPLRALANDVQKNLEQPLAELRAMDPSLPEVRVAVRSGDTLQKDRAKMLRRPPHLLVTTPESLHILTTSVRARAMLQTAGTLIVDEIHALAQSKRGSHFALTCERLEHLVQQNGGALQRIGLSATQRPIEDTAGLLTGAERPCEIVNVGHRRTLDLGIDVPAPLETVCSGEHWEEIFARMQEQIEAHRTTLVFVNTRKMAERVAARLADRLGKEKVTSHHGSLAKERRLDAEQRLKRGELQALVATSSLELGIDVGDVDLVLQVGPTPSIAAFLQRVGRSGHALAKTPKGRLLPLTRDELVASAAIVYAVQRGDLDRTRQPNAPLDVLAQQVIAACCDEVWPEDELFALARRAWPFRGLTRERFDAVLAMHATGRAALLHRDSVHQTVRATRRARLTSVTCGGAIPDVADWKVVLDHDDTPVGTVHEDFAIESSVGDVFQLGSTSWQVKRIGSGTLRVADANGVPPSLPFWIAEGPSRSDELARAVSDVRVHGIDASWLVEHCLLTQETAEQLAEYLRGGLEALGATPSHDTLVLERFFDETGGQQLILHAPFGARINRAFGLALRKRFCVGFGFELQAAANDEALLISLGPMHSFPLADVWEFLHPKTVRDVLIQAMLPAPLFQARWRWNVTTALLVERFRSGGKVPAPLLRFRADDALAEAFPAAQACPETLTEGPIDVPLDHPLVQQTVTDSLHDAMDYDGLHALLVRIQDGSIRLVECEGSTPSPFADGILHAMPYAFLDDAPLEERRTQAVTSQQRGASASPRDGGSELDPKALEEVRQQCWPAPRSAAELHEALGWMGWLEHGEAPDAWRVWLEELAADGRAIAHGTRWFAAEAPTELLPAWRGRVEAVIPIWDDELGGLGSSGVVGSGVAARSEEAGDRDREALRALEAEGLVMRATCGGRSLWAHRRLLARVRRAMVERLRRDVQPVTKADFERFLQTWQHRADGCRLGPGPAALAQVLRQFAGTSHSASEWEGTILPRHFGTGESANTYHREWLDQVTLSGEFVWLRLWGAWRGPLSKLPLTLLPREQLQSWLRVPLSRPSPDDASGEAATLLELLQTHGALFPTDLQQNARLLPSHFERALGELVGLGLATCDSFAAMRQLSVPPSRRRFPLFAVGRWSLIPLPDAEARADDESIDTVCDALLQRYGVLSHAILLAHREPIPWRLLLRSLRARELRGEVRGGHFVRGWAGEQFALATAVTALRRARDEAAQAASLTQAGGAMN
ncbi:MAG: DEAD/DEAH box helicase [Planctomycetota bacterium]